MADGIWTIPPDTSYATARLCSDGLVHFIYYEKLKGSREPGQWLRICDCNDDGVSVRSLPLRRVDLTCIACVALESKGTLLVRED